MTDRAAYIRGARLTIWTPRPDPTTRLGALFGAVVPNALVVENLRITWSVKKDGTSKPNPATITINNLAETSRAEVGRLPKRMALEVGYNGRLRQLWPCYLPLAVTAMVALTGGAAMIEMIYHLQLNSAQGSTLKFMGMVLDTRSLNSWFGAVFVLLTGLGLFEVARRQFAREWGEIQEYIEKEIKRREAL